eukprot:2009658-Alexandrium_andersonii.AAC.1
MARGTPLQLAAMQRKAHEVHASASQQSWDALSSSGILGFHRFPDGVWQSRAVPCLCCLRCGDSFSRRAIAPALEN